MRIELDDPRQFRHSITTKNARILGEWFADTVAPMMDIRSDAMPIRVMVFPQDAAEMQAIGRMGAYLQPEALLALADALNPPRSTEAGQ